MSDPYDRIRAGLTIALAHKQAWEKGEILHRDVSVGNMLIVEQERVTPKGAHIIAPEGMLTDWELSKPRALLQQQIGRAHV